MNLRILATVAILVMIAIPASTAMAQTHDFSPAFSADGQVLAWLHSEEGKTTLCLAQEPFEKLASATVLNGEIAIALRAPLQNGRFTQRLALSGDGLNVFLAADKIWHFKIADGSLGQPQSIAAKQGKASWLCANEEGTALAILLDGPPINTSIDSMRGSPSWQALATASLEGGKWKLGQELTPAQNGKFAIKPMIAPDGKSVIYNYDKKNLQAPLGGTEPKEIRIPGFSFRPGAMSADGKTLMVTGRDITDDQSLGNKNIFILKKEDSAWQKPELVQRDPDVENLDNVVMSSDAKTIIHESFVRAGKDKEPRKTQLLAIRRSEGEWGQPVVVFEREGVAAFGGIAVSKGKQVAYAVQAKDGGPFVLFLRGDLKADTQGVNLSELAKKTPANSISKPQPATTTKPTTSASAKD